MVTTKGSKIIEGKGTVDTLKLVPTASAPTAEQGLLYFDSTEQMLKVSTDGSDFAPVSPSLKSLYQSIIANRMNARKATVTAGFVDSDPDDCRALIHGTNEADVSTNWTYNSTDKSYENTQTAQATLAFNTVITGRQQNLWPTISKAVCWVNFRDTGDLDVSRVQNYSFETAGGGGADVFANWTEALQQPTGGSVAWSQGTGNGVTNGTFCAAWTGTITNTSPTAPSGSLTQGSVDVTGIKFFAMDYRLNIVQTGGTVLAQNLNITLQIGSASASGTAAVSNATNLTSGTILVDVSALTGTQTVTISVSQGGGGFGSRTYTLDARADYLRGYDNAPPTANLTRQVQMKVDASTWENVTPGEPHTFANTGNSLGVRVVETRTDGSTINKDVVQGLGVIILE